MMIIDTTRLPAGQVLHAVDAYRVLEINEVPDIARSEDEYLCFNRIPSIAVIREVSFEELRFGGSCTLRSTQAREEAEDEASWERQQHVWRIEHDPFYHYNAEFGKCDSEDEAELKRGMIEGDW